MIMRNPITLKLIFPFFAFLCLSAFGQSLSDQYNSQQQAEKIKKLREADKEALSKKNHSAPITTNDLVERGYRLKCDFPKNTSDTDFYYNITTEDSFFNNVLIDNKTVDYRDPKNVKGELKKVGDKIQHFMLIPFGNSGKVLDWEFDTKNNIAYIKRGKEIHKFNCALVKFMN